MSWKRFIWGIATNTTAWFFQAARGLRADVFYWLRTEDPIYLLWLLKHKRQFGSAAPPGTGKPLFSILAPAYNTRPEWLNELVASVRQQTCGGWELILIDDASDVSASRAALTRLAARDPRIKLLRNESNRGIAASTNRGAEAASGDWLLLLDHDDVLYPDTLAALAAGAQRYPDATVLYADEDRFSPRGLRYRYHFKPAFSPSLLEMCNYILHPMCIRRDAWQQVGGMKSDLDGSQDYDLLLRLWDSGAEIRHIPGVFYTWRESDASMAGGAFKPQIFNAGKQALREHLLRRGDSFKEIDDNPQTELGDYRIRWRIPPETRVLLLSEAPPIEPSEWRLTHRKISSGIGAALQAAANETWDAVVFLSPGLAADSHSLEELIGWCLRDDVGVVGGRILDEKDRILHAGLSLASNGSLQVDFFAQPVIKHPAAQRLRDCLAVCDALAVAGDKLAVLAPSLSADPWPLALCLAARARAWRVLCTPFTDFRGPSSAILNLDQNRAHRLLTSYAITQDPFANPHAALTYRLDTPLRWRRL